MTQRARRQRDCRQQQVVVTLAEGCRWAASGGNGNARNSTMLAMAVVTCWLLAAGPSNCGRGRGRRLFVSCLLLGPVILITILKFFSRSTIPIIVYARLGTFSSAPSTETSRRSARADRSGRNCESDNNIRALAPVSGFARPLSRPLGLVFTGRSMLGRRELALLPAPPGWPQRQPAPRADQSADDDPSPALRVGR